MIEVTPRPISITYEWEIIVKLASDYIVTYQKVLNKDGQTQSEQVSKIIKRGNMIDEDLQLGESHPMYNEILVGVETHIAKNPLST